MKQFLNKVIVCNEKFDELYGDFTGLDNKMKARITRIERSRECDEGNELGYKITLDFSEFVEYNRQFETESFYTAIPGELAKWSDSNYYPKSHKEELYVYEKEFSKGVEIVTSELNEELAKVKSFIETNNLTKAAKFLNL